MNCPHHHQIYSAHPRSYRDLPVRIAEYGTVYRYEKSGELFGLMRSRMLSMNDAHIYCTPEQFPEEFRAVNEMYLNYFKLFGFEKYVMRFSTHDPSGLGKKYVDEARLWKETEDMVRDVLSTSNINFEEVPNEAAFYGPKIDVQVWSAIGREFTIATNQVDFAQPRSFGLTYTDSKGEDAMPIVIHRAPLGTHERFIGFLIEHFAGAFPVWLSPVQAAVLPVSDKHADYGEKVITQLRESEVRAEMPASSETLGKRIRAMEMQKVPYILVVGDEERHDETVTVRRRGTEKQRTEKIGTFVENIQKEIKERAL
jgi:threonyl-tRNA synthetase